MQKETVFKIKVQKRLKEEFGQDCFFFKVQQVSLRGIPDVIGALHGYFFAWELKKSIKDKPSPLQAHILGQIDRAGGLARMVCPENLERSIKELKAFCSRQ